MVKTAGGSFHRDDFVGNSLAGLTVDQVIEVGQEFGIDVAKYGHLNRGQQRMAIGNALRKLVPDPDSDASVTLQDMADEFKGVNAVAAEEKVAAKEAAKAEKAAAKEAAKAEKAEKAAAARAAKAEAQVD
jgi:hypothetical protein